VGVTVSAWVDVDVRIMVMLRWRRLGVLAVKIVRRTLDPV
jgi:hypothetical protein